jgi:hypothetical protein
LKGGALFEVEFMEIGSGKKTIETMKPTTTFVIPSTFSNYSSGLDG